MTDRVLLNLCHLKTLLPEVKFLVPKSFERDHSWEEVSGGDPSLE